MGHSHISVNHEYAASPRIGKPRRVIIKINRISPFPMHFRGHFLVLLDQFLLRELVPGFQVDCGQVVCQVYDENEDEYGEDYGVYSCVQA